MKKILGIRYFKMHKHWYIRIILLILLVNWC